MTISLRSWLVSGTFAATMGAGMLCGAGFAAADNGGDQGTAGASAHATTQSPRSEKAPRRAAATNARPTAAAAVRTPGARIAAAVKAADSAKAAAPAKAAASALVSAKPAAKTLPASGGLKNALKSGRPGTAKPAAAVASPPKAAAVVAAPAAAAQPAPVAPAPVDPAQFAGTYYEQASVKQFFAVGLVNTSATYTLNPDGSLKVLNRGNYFFNRGPRSQIVGSAVAVNADNTALNVGFSPFGKPSANPPGNYTILYHAPDYSYVIVSDPSYRSGYVLTRSKTVSPQEYQQLVDQARSLGITGRITTTKQYA